MASNALKYVAVRRASLTAAEANAKPSAKTASEYCKMTRSAIEFQILTLQSELKTLDELSSMADDEKMVTLFNLLDKDGNGKIDGRELASGLRKVRGDEFFEQSLELAIDKAASFDTDEDAMLDFMEFENFINSFLKDVIFYCDFQELSEMLITQIIFAESPKEEIEERDRELVEEEPSAEDEEYRKALTDERMKVLFQLFDINDDGVIGFKEVVVGMYKLTEDAEGASRAALRALLLFDEKHTRTLDYEGFTKLIINIVSALGNVKFDDVADAMTRVAAQPLEITDEDLLRLLEMDKNLQSFRVRQDKDSQAEGYEYIFNDAEYGKIDCMFDMWDLDGDGYIGFRELVVGLRKFQEASLVKETVEESLNVMKDFDADSDQQLNREEFAEFLAKFAQLSGTDLVSLLDFMIVISALKENTDAEKAYVRSIRTSTVEIVPLLSDVDS